ncbi:MAG: molybdopterin cofactor-binding domain-containing protein, partial [Planctomycetota bacterium]
ELDVLYEVPFQAHAPMEPLSCMVTLKPDGGTYLVTGSQMLGVDHMVACQRLGVGPEKVVIENSYLGGGFGRRANPASDFTLEALEVSLAAKDLNAPIKTVWSREDDIRGGWYRPMYANRMTASFKDGKISGWRHRIVGQSMMEGTILASAMIQDGIDTSTVEGAWHLPYAVPNKKTELHTVDIPVPIQWWRSVGHSNTAFAKESFIDECAERLNKDPYQFRRELLSEHPRLLRVLDLAAEKSGWDEKPAEGVGRGIAVHESFESFVAHVVEASVVDGIPKIHRIVCAVDCGPVVNPDQVEAQLQGGAMFALSSVLEGEIRFKNGRVMESNFGDFKVVRMNQSPKIECHIVPSTDSMGGLGEPGVPTVASAVCSAIHAACRKRIRRLPIGKQLQG